MELFINLGCFLRFFFFDSHYIITKYKIYGQPLFVSVMLIRHFQITSTLLSITHILLLETVILCLLAKRVGNSRH